MLPRIELLRDGHARSDYSTIPIQEYIDALPPYEGRGAGTGGGGGGDGKPSGGAYLVASEPWMLEHLQEKEGRHGPRGRHPSDDSKPIGEVDELGDIDEEDDADAVAVDVYLEMDRARALCHFPELYPTFRVRPLGGDDCLERLHVAYDAYRG